MSLPLFFPFSSTYRKLGNKQESNEGNNGTKGGLIDQKADLKVNVMIGGKLFTSYCYSDRLMKQILYPKLTEAGKPFTRVGR